MKSLLLTIALGAAAVIPASATVFTVNNNNPSPGQYLTPAAAQAVAQPGDTLYISGSIYNYNNFVISKRITLIGTGHKPLTPNPAASKFDDISFSTATGATNMYDVNIIGLDVNSITYNVGYLRRQYVSRCKVRDAIYLADNQDSILIEGNYLASTGTNLNVNYGYTYSNITLRNNVFNGSIYNFFPAGNFTLGLNLNLYLSNNLFLTAGNLFTGSSNRYLQLRNNIFYRADPNALVTNSTFENNIIYQASTNSFPTGSSNVSTNNLNNTNPLFVNFPSGGDYYSYAYDFRLQTSPTPSPAINAGSDGKDIGLTGGDGFFQKFGIPNIPQINTFNITSPANATIAPGGTLQISVMSTIGR